MDRLARTAASAPGPSGFRCGASGSGMAAGPSGGGGGVGVESIEAFYAVPVLLAGGRVGRRLAVEAGHHVEAEQAAFQRAVEEWRLARLFQAQHLRQAQVGGEQ